MKYFSLLIVVLLFQFTCSIKQTKDVEQHRLLSTLTDCNRKFHHNELAKESAVVAKKLISRFPSTVPIKDRMAVMILFSRGFQVNHQHKNRLEFLHCALTKLLRNLPNTTVDVFVWTINTTSTPSIIPSWLTEVNFPRVNLMEIPDETWKIPCGLIDDSEWVVRKKFDVDYYLMGRWRLTFSFDFVKEMGYTYHLQFDDDAMLNNKIDYNIVEKLKTSNIEMAVFSDLIGEVPHVVLGLPELTNFWLKTNKYSPIGTLYKHLNPMGLTSEGWDRMYHPGYFLIVNIDFWYQDEVQSYLTTVLRSGKDVEGRWQEQAVINMMRLVFVNEKKLLIMNDVDIGHDRHKKANFENWCTKAGIIMVT